MHEIMRVFLIVCGVLVVNMFIQMIRAAATPEKPVPRKGRKQNPATIPAAAPADAAPVEAAPTAPKKRGHPRKTEIAAVPVKDTTPAPVPPLPVTKPVLPAPVVKPLTPASAYAYGQIVTSRPYTLAEFAKCMQATP
jgi:hypothetical protein